MGKYKYVKLLGEIGKRNFSLVGGKGANLGEMTAAGLPVPEGFVVLTEAYKKFVYENKLEIKIDALVDDLEDENLNQLEATSERIKELLAY